MKITKIKYWAVALLTLLSWNASQAQRVVEYGSPVGFAITLAGNFGEIRPNHFHSGIDIKALKGVGSPIYAVADGYISRISVSPTGYGNMLMVTHPNGTHSLYGHLDGFVEKYSQYIQKQQRSAKQYKVDRYIEKGLFPVKKGDVIGYLGNSGSSAGPHLHFEIRDAAANALNPLIKGGYHVADRIAPTAFKAHIYQRDTTIFGVPIFQKPQTIELELRNGIYTAKTETPKINKPFYIAYEVIDYKDGRSNTMGITAMEQKVNGTKNFGIEINKISFATTRHINTLVQYEKNSSSRFHVLRAYHSANNQLAIYKGVANQGIIKPLKPGEKIKIETTLWDDNQNHSKVELNLTCEGAPASKSLKLKPTQKVAFANMPFAYADSIISIKMDAGTLYESTFINIDNKDGIFTIGDLDTPLQRSYTLELDIEIDPKLRAKALLMGESRKGKWYSVGGAYSNNSLKVKVSSLGRFKVAYDTTAPKIQPTIKDGETANQSLKFKITDDLSGIVSYNIYIDNQWVIAEYDPRIAQLKTSIKKGETPGLHDVKVVVTDYKGNKQELKQRYKW